MPRTLWALLAIAVTLLTSITVHVNRARDFDEERRAHAVADALEIYRSDGIAEVSGESLACYSRATRAIASDRLRRLMIERCIAIDWVGFLVDGAVSAALKVTPIDYFEPINTKARIQRHADIAKLGKDDLEKLLADVDRIWKLDLDRQRQIHGKASRNRP